MAKENKFNYTAATALRPGLVATPAGTIFAVQAPRDATVELLLYEAGKPRASKTIQLPEEGRVGALWAVCVELPQDREIEYLYRVDGRECCDPCARKLRVFRTAKKESRRAVAVAPSLANTTIPGIPWEETVFYKLHVRGFSMSRYAGVKKKGTFAGLAEKIDYIRDLGMTSVILMPCHELPEEESGNYWGYAEGYYYAPCASYSAGDDPVSEFRSLVETMHGAGLECLPEFFFPDHMPARNVMDILRHWALAYGVDGFHLLGRGAWLSEVLRDPVLADRKILCEETDARTFDNVGLYDRQYSYALRKFLRGDRDLSIGELGGFLTRGANGLAPINFLADQDGFTLADTFAYAEKHNEENGQDNRDGTDYNLSYNCGFEGATNRKEVLDLRWRKTCAALSVLFLSRGTPMLYAGDEFGNSQDGNNNAWCQDNGIGHLTWSRSARASRLQDLVRQLLKLRREYPLLRTGGTPRKTDALGLGFPDVSFHNRSAWVSEAAPARDGLGVYCFGAYAKEGSSPSLYLACNTAGQNAQLALPAAPDSDGWELLFHSAGADQVLQLSEDMSSVILPPNSVLLLAGKKTMNKGEKA